MKLLLTFVAALTLSVNASAAPGDVTGTVVESMNSGGYTYLLLMTASGQKSWAAVTKTTVKTGAMATVTNAMEMRDFESPTLKRKFDRILFGALADASAPAGDPHAGAKSGAMGGKPADMKHGGRAEVKGPIKVAKAAGPDGRTIAEVYAQKAALKDKDVVVTGKVVKYNSGILERNWAHLRDGSGKAKDGSDDLTVILKDESAVGQVITVKGKVVLNKDLGGMYKFPVALEDAVLVK